MSSRRTFEKDTEAMFTLKQLRVNYASASKLKRYGTLYESEDDLRMSRFLY